MLAERAGDAGPCRGACGAHGPTDRPVPLAGPEEDAAPRESDPVLAFADGAALAAFGGLLVRLASLTSPAGPR